MQSDSASVLPQKTTIDGQVFSVQCANSTDFVVGRQTNFHAPVTIINCPLPKVDEGSDRIVIRDQLWAQNATNILQMEAEKSAVGLATTVDITNNGSCKKLVDDDAASKGNTSFKQLAQKRIMGVPAVGWFFIFLVIIACLAGAAVQFSLKSPSDLQSERIYIGDKSHEFVPRAEWGALNATSKIPIAEPTPYVVISHTAGRLCYQKQDCIEIISTIQKDQMSRNPRYADISYNFMVGGDGNIYEGRGWGIRNAHSGDKVDSRNIGINFLGDFSVSYIPTLPQVDAVIKLLERGVQDCHIHPNYILVAHNATAATLSPGRNVYEVISQWEHFRPTVEPIVTNRGMATACKIPKAVSNNSSEAVTNTSDTTTLIIDKTTTEAANHT